MNRNLKRIAFVLVTLMLVLASFTACNMGLPWDIEVWGVWEADNTAFGSDEKTIMTLKNNSISVDMPSAWASDYSGEVVSFDNNSYNVAEDNPTTGDYGHLIFKITDHQNTADWAQAMIGKYSVIRWSSVTETELTYSESGIQFETIQEAEAADTTNFTYFSTLTRSEE